jgi:MFS superfamily sulfate permease-like transporter
MIRAAFHFATWLFAFRGDWLRAAVVIPKAMALAIIAGLTVEAGSIQRSRPCWSIRCSAR